MNIEQLSDDFEPDYPNSSRLNYADTYRALAFIAGMDGDVDARHDYLIMAEMYDQR